MWLVTSLAQLPGVDPAVAGRRFAALLPAPGARRAGAAAREPACVQLLKLFILDRPAAASALVAQDAGALGRFFKGPRRRTELWFGHFGHGGNVGSFRFGAGALARFALQHRSEARPARPPRRAGAASRCLRRPQRRAPQRAAGMGSLRTVAHLPGARLRTLCRAALPKARGPPARAGAQVWDRLVWRGKHAQAPVAVAAKPHYFGELDVVASVAALAAADGGAFWRSVEVREAAAGGGLVELDPDFFAQARRPHYVCILGYYLPLVTVCHCVSGGHELVGLVPGWLPGWVPVSHAP